MEGIYRVSPPLSVLNSLREALDSDPSSVSTQDPRWDHTAFAGALKHFLRELPDPVIPNDLYARFVNAASEILPMRD